MGVLSASYFQSECFCYNSQTTWKLSFIILLDNSIYNYSLKCLKRLNQIHGHCLNAQEKVPFKIFNETCELLNGKIAVGVPYAQTSKIFKNLYKHLEF